MGRHRIQAFVYLGHLSTSKKDSTRIVNKLVEAEYWLVTVWNPKGFRYKKSSQHSQALLSMNLNGYSPKMMARVLRKHSSWYRLLLYLPYKRKKKNHWECGVRKKQGEKNLHNAKRQNNQQNQTHI